MPRNNSPATALTCAAETSESLREFFFKNQNLKLGKATTVLFHKILSEDFLVCEQVINFDQCNPTDISKLDLEKQEDLERARLLLVVLKNTIMFSNNILDQDASALAQFKEGLLCIYRSAQTLVNDSSPKKIIIEVQKIFAIEIFTSPIASLKKAFKIK